MKTWTDAVAKLGVGFIQYIPMNGYIVAARPDEMADVSKLPYVQFVDIFHAVLKSQAVSRTKGVQSDLLISVANVADVGKTVTNLDREYAEATVVYVPDDELPEIRKRAADQKLDLAERDDFDVLQLPNGYLDVRLGAEASLPGKRLGPPGRTCSTLASQTPDSGRVRRTPPAKMMRDLPISRMTRAAPAG